jgi:hypothetical protein
VNNNAHGYTPAKIYAAIGQSAAAAVQDHIARADAVIAALTACGKAAETAAATGYQPAQTHVSATQAA